MAAKTEKVDPNKCKHEELSFLNGGGRLVCTACQAAWNMVDRLGRPRYDYFNIWILFGDKRAKV